MLKVFVK